MAVERRKGTLHFLVVFLVICYLYQPAGCLQEYLGSCGLTIDLVMTPNIQSAILTMPMPESMDRYQDPAQPINCDVIIAFTSGMNLMLELYFLDIMPKSSDITTCSTGLEIFDQTGSKYYGGRICMEAWQWEERHREKQQEKVVVKNSPLTFRLVSGGPYRGEGFKLHFGQFRPYWPCYTREFKCQQVQRCVHDDLTCDGWDDCGDYSDERYEAGCNLLTACEICSLIMGVLLLAGTAAQFVVFGITYRRLRQQYGMRSDSKIPIASDRYNMDPVFGVGRQYNSQDSIPSRLSRPTAPTMSRRGSDSDIVDKADLEKADRVFNKAGDNMSERSYRSNPRRTMAQSLGSVVPSDAVKKSGQYSYGSRKGRSSSQSSLSRDKLEAGNIDDTSVDHDSLDSREKLSDKNRRYSRKHDLDSDSNEYDDRDRYDDRKRRSSRERDRKRTDRYSDDDSDYDRDRRRRRRRRSYDSYSDDSDYEYEREKDRRRRSRERYSDDEYERKRDRRRSRERYSDDRYEDEDESDRGRDKERDRDKQSYRKGSRDRNRERYSQEKYDDNDDTDRDQGKDFEKDRDRYRRHSRDRDRERYRDSYDEDRAYRKRLDDDDEHDTSARRRRSTDKRRGQSAERDRSSGDLSRNENRRSRSRDILTSVDTGRQSPALPMPPPYTEEDPRQPQKQPASRDSSNPSTTEQNLSSSEHFKGPEQQNSKVPSVEYRHREPQVSKLPSAADARQNDKPPAKEINETDRRKSNDDRRERYSRSRWTPKKRNPDSPPPEYEDVAPKSAFVGISYKEESV